MGKASFGCIVLFKGLLTGLMGKAGLIAMVILPFGIGEA
jgi:hypothetical protein